MSTKVFRHNSVDLADIKAEINITEDFELEFDFLEWAIAATTLVGKPAFANAAAELGDEIKAAYEPSDDVLEIELEWVFSGQPPALELTASAGTTVPYDDFHIPESDEPHKIVVDADERVYGTLAEWGKPHRSFLDRLVTCPRPTDGYRSFNHKGPLTERGQVGTGPIFLIGGHAGGRSLRGLDRDQVSQAMGGVENAWADVRVTEGRHGPWVSGRLRPGLTDEQIHAAALLAHLRALDRRRTRRHRLGQRAGLLPRRRLRPTRRTRRRARAGGQLPSDRTAARHATRR